MTEWTWTRTRVDPDDILDGLDTLRPTFQVVEVDLTAEWVPSDLYLSWAESCLERGDGFSMDAAISYAKRAVCRQIDGMIVNNHLGCFLGSDYPTRLHTLTDIGLNAPDILHELIINPRNGLEHDYEQATPADARKAVQLAKLFLQATVSDMEHKAIVSFAWSLYHSFSRGPDYERIEFRLKSCENPMMIIDVVEPDDHQVLILRPAEMEITHCPLSTFDRRQAINLATKLRQQLGQGSCSGEIYQLRWLRKLKEDIAL